MGPEPSHRDLGKEARAENLSYSIQTECCLWKSLWYLWSAVLSVTFNPSGSMKIHVNTFSLCLYWLNEGENKRVQSELLFNVEFVYFFKT